VRVGIDGTGWSNRRGHGRFTRNVVERLVAADGDATYVVFVDEAAVRQLELPSNVEVRTVALSRLSVEADSRRRIRDLLRLSWSVSRDRPDVFLFPSLYTYFPVIGMPTVVGVHDTIAEDHPELTLPTRRARTYWSAKRRLALRSATELFTVSQAARRALVERFGLREDRVAVVPEAPAALFRPRTEAEMEAALAALGLHPQSYFLFAGGISPHKNLETLLAAYSKLRLARDVVPPLVLVGDLDDESYLSATDRVRRQIATLGLAEHVRLPGFVSDESLACLYTGASCVVLPSLAEGFGLPAVEAAACGAPLVVSDLPAHRETLDGAALFVQPTDVVGFAAALGRILDDPSERDVLARRGQQAVAHLTWDAAADALRRLLDDAVAGGSAHG